MLTESDFEQIIANSIKDYPTLAPLYQAKDPRILQPLQAMATMFSMLSAQMDTSMMEVFRKTRNGTVLADAAMRGIVPKGEPAVATIKIVNNGTSDFIIDVGRTLTDSSGMSWAIESCGIVKAQSTIEAQVKQIITERVTHHVDDTKPFYAISINKPNNDDSYFLAGISVADKDGDFSYSDRYTNIMAGDRVFHVEADERSRVFISFGLDGVVGFQPPNGHDFEITITWTQGAAVKPTFETPFNFDYIATPSDMQIKMSMMTMIKAGVNPLPIDVIRDLSRYPSTYDHNAVFLGEFDFLLRYHFPELAFIAVWNEAVEEKIRGASVDNINRLFVSVATSKDGLQVEQDHEVAFSFVSPENYTPKHRDIIETIAKADNSYRVRFVNPVIRYINVSIYARVSKVYQIDTVRAQIIQTVLSEFGAENMAFGQRLKESITNNLIGDKLRDKVHALSNDQADIKVDIADDALPTKPEVLYLVREESIILTVTHVKTNSTGWR